MLSPLAFLYPYITLHPILSSNPPLSLLPPAHSSLPLSPPLPLSVICRSGPKPHRPQSYPAPSRCGPSRSGPTGRCGPSRSGPIGSMRPQSIRPHFTQKTFYWVRLTYDGPALVDPAPLCIQNIFNWSFYRGSCTSDLRWSGLGRSGPISF